jgi:outer membrane lipoprotein-sorting protein
MTGYMRISRIGLTLYFLFLGLYLLNAQVVDKKSIAILDDVSNKTKSYKTIRIEFTYKIEEKAGGINESKYGVILLKGDKYNLDISGQNVISNGKTVWTYIKDADEIHINNANPEDDNISFNKLLTNYNKDFRSKLIKQDKLNGEDVYIIDLMPKKGKSFHRVRLTVSVQKKQVMNAAIYDKNGTTYTYSLKKFIPDQPLKDDTFVFKPSDHPKAEVIDMR